MSYNILSRLRLDSISAACLEGPLYVHLKVTAIIIVIIIIIIIVTLIRDIYLCICIYTWYTHIWKHTHICAYVCSMCVVAGVSGQSVGIQQRRGQRWLEGGGGGHRGLEAQHQHVLWCGAGIDSVDHFVWSSGVSALSAQTAVIHRLQCYFVQQPQDTHRHICMYTHIHIYIYIYI